MPANASATSTAPRCAAADMTVAAGQWLPGPCPVSRRASRAQCSASARRPSTSATRPRTASAVTRRLGDSSEPAGPATTAASAMRPCATSAMHCAGRTTTTGLPG
jgi:hypothetical protein